MNKVSELDDKNNDQTGDGDKYSKNNRKGYNYNNIIIINN
jgi:hypothetical protein